LMVDLVVVDGVVVVRSSEWLFCSHLQLAGVNSLRVSPKCTSHVIKLLRMWSTSSPEQTTTRLTSLVALLAIHTHVALFAVSLSLSKGPSAGLS
jgi:hypothetical protein